MMTVFTSIALTCFITMMLSLYNTLVVKPNRLRSLLRKQGVSGPSPTLFLGNMEISKSANNKTPLTSQVPVSHNIGSFIFPIFDQWIKQYGKLFVYCHGNMPTLMVVEPDMLRDISKCVSLDLGKPAYLQNEYGPLLGQGIVSANGDVWSYERKLMAPEFHLGNVTKNMASLMIESTVNLIESWNGIIESENGSEVDIKIDEHIRKVSGDVISRACFGINYTKGQEIFINLRNILMTLSKIRFGFGFLRHLPTKINRELWRLEKEVCDLVRQVVKERNEGAYKKDLLQLVLEGVKNNGMKKEAKERFIVDNCKNIYFAYTGTASSMIWCLMLLAANQDWQDSVRAEVLDVCGGCNPDSDMLSKMKKLTMVIHETLRLYNPAITTDRETLKDMKIGNINVPKGTVIWTWTSAIHTDPEVWGPDSYKFNPSRFANGIAGACKLPHMYMPFGMGSRVCLGQHLAMTEFKIVISMLLSNFSFSISPNYIHSPIFQIIVAPEHGVNLLVNKL